MPQLIKVFQIVIDKNLSDLINAEGWDCHVNAKAYIEAQEGRASIGLANGCYSHVANIVADDINHARFESLVLAIVSKLDHHDIVLIYFFHVTAPYSLNITKVN